MAAREIVVLGTASQAPTRRRNHNGLLLRWDGEGLLFDPGEGTQRQMVHAGVASSAITRICLTHFHGDHCLGLPGVVQRLSPGSLQGPAASLRAVGGRGSFRGCGRRRCSTPRRGQRSAPSRGSGRACEA